MNKLRKSKSIKLAKAKADKYFAEYIRLRDKDKPCITCGNYGQKDCGHFISRRYEAVRFNEKNANGQCLKCNRYMYGLQYEHGKQVDRIYGDGTADKLLLMSKQFCKRDKNDYEQIALYYKTKIENNDFYE